MTNLIVSDSTFYKNEGIESGTVHIRSYTNGTITSSKFIENKSELNGAVTAIEISSVMRLSECETEKNEARLGGVFYIVSYSEFYSEKSSMMNDYALYGCVGFVDGASDQIYLIDFSMVEPAHNCSSLVYDVKKNGQLGQYYV